LNLKKAFSILQAFERRYKKMVNQLKTKLITEVVSKVKRTRQDIGLEDEPDVKRHKEEPEPEKEDPKPKKPKQDATGDGSTPPPVPLPGGKPIRRVVSKGNQQKLNFEASRKK